MPPLKTPIINHLKAFAYQWYARFDRGTRMAELLPFLPDAELEFVYPSATLTSIEALSSYMTPALAAHQASRHVLQEIAVDEVAERTYELLLPHSYQVRQADGTVLALHIMARMRVQLELPTRLDPAGHNPKVLAYKVVVLDTPATDIPASEGLATAVVEAPAANEIKAFVHAWFARIDEGDMTQISPLLADGPLDIDLLGYAFHTRPEFLAFLTMQKNAQRFSSHSPACIKVTPQEAGRYGAEFLLQFQGELTTDSNLLRVNNITHWELLRDASGALRLHRYRLEIV